MLDVAIVEFWYLGLLLLAPFLLARKTRYTRWILGGLSFAVYALSIGSLAQGALALLWLALPFVYVKLLPRAKRWPIIALLVLGFVYMNGYLQAFELPTFDFRLLGLSYILFRQIDFVVQSKLLIERGVYLCPLDYMSYLLCFYTVTAGPITRFEPYKDSVDSPYEVDPLRQLHRFANGCIKVFLLSTIASEYSAHFLALAREGAGLYFLPFAALNALFIYVNFSGYCDIVIAAAAIAGLKLPENFDKPWLAPDMQEFWNRWHITLSTWIRDYIFQPLYKLLLGHGMRRFKRMCECLCLLVTFALAGLWHGADWNFLVYGLLQGIGVFAASFYKAAMRRKLGKEGFARLNEQRYYRIACRTLTLVYVCGSFAFVGNDILSLIWGA